MKKLYTSGDDLPYWEITRPRLEAYAESIGAELVVLPKRSHGNPQWIIFDAMELGAGSWIDADIIVSEGAPDLARFGKSLMVAEPGTPRRVHPKWMRGHSNKEVPNPRPYPITAIASWSAKTGAKIAAWVAGQELTGDLPEAWGDQEVLALAIWELDIPMHFFPSRWHRMMRQAGTLQKGCHFAHAAGYTRRPKLKKAHLRAFVSKMQGEGR